MAILINGAAVAPSFGNVTQTDFSDVTAHPEFVQKGKKFYDETGRLKTGTAELIQTPTQEKEIDITENGTTEVTPDEGFALSKVTVNANIESGGSGGGAELNIAYGDTAPEDTSKLWVKTNKPNKVTVSGIAPSGSNTGAYDSASNNGSLSSNRMCSCAATVGTNTYVFGGRYNNYLCAEIYKLTGNTYASEVGSIGTSMDKACCAPVGTKIYLFGGNTVATGNPNPKNTIYCFDTETETITTLSAVLPVATCGMCCAAVGTKIYLFGGYDVNKNHAETIYCFDAETETITTLETVITDGLYMAGCAAVDTNIYIFGGTNYNTGAQNKIRVFDTVTGGLTILEETLPDGIMAMGCCALGTLVIVYGGITKGDNGDYKKALAFDTSSYSLRVLGISVGFPAYAVVVPFPNSDTNVWVVGGASNTYATNNNYGSKLTYRIKLTVASQIALESGHLFIKCSMVTNANPTNEWLAVNNQDSNITMHLIPTIAFYGNNEGVGQSVTMRLYQNDAWTII